MTTAIVILIDPLTRNVEQGGTKKMYLVHGLKIHSRKASKVSGAAARPVGTVQWKRGNAENDYTGEFLKGYQTK